MRGQVEEVVVAIVVVVVVVVEHGSAASTIILDARNTNRQKKMTEKTLRDCPFIVKLFASQVKYNRILLKQKNFQQFI